MKASEIITRAQKYLDSDDTQIRFICCDSAAVLLDIRQQLCIGNTRLIEAHAFSRDDELPDMGALLNTLKNEEKPVVLSGFFTEWKLLGEEKLSDKISQLIQYAKVPCSTIMLCHQPAGLLKFTDPRYSRLVWNIEGNPDPKPELRFVSPNMPEYIKCRYISGINMLSAVISEGNIPEQLAVRTQKTKSSYPCSIIPITEQKTAYEALCEIDPSTEKLNVSFGSEEQWQSALDGLSGSGSWDRYISSEFGSTDKLDASFEATQSSDDFRRWLYYIALKLCGAQRNMYLSIAAEHAHMPAQLIHEIYRSVLTFDADSKEFSDFYSERKKLLSELKNTDDEAIDFCSIVCAEKGDPLPYLTACTKAEREKIIAVLSECNDKSDRTRIEQTLKNVYPDLYFYLQPFNYGNDLLNRYFSEYKYEKLVNRIFPDFEQLVYEQAEKRDYNAILPPRSEVVEKLDKSASCLYFVDAMGVEYLSWIMQKCSEMKLSANVTICRCELPSLTFCNKDFVTSFENAGAPVYSIKKLDDIKHHGEQNFDYTQNKYPTHLIRELEIISNVLSTAKKKLKSGEFSTVYMISDHGASRLAVIKEHTLDINVNSKGTHSGRVCALTDDISEVSCATKSGDYYVLANYDRFKGGRAANVEVHGGATLEELTVPVIALTIAPESIEITILTPEITISFRKKAEIRLYSNTRLNDVSILVSGNFYKAEYDGTAYTVKMPDIRKAKQYTADVYSGSTVVKTGLSFTVKKEGASEKELF